MTKFSKKKKAMFILFAVVFILTNIYIRATIWFVDFAEDGKYSNVEKMLNFGLKADSNGILEKTALMAAADSGHVEVVKLLIENGADVNAVNKDGWTPILFASDYGNAEIIQILLDAGADINIQETDGYTPLMWAASEGHSRAVKKLIDNQAELDNRCTYFIFNGYTALIFAADQGDLKICNMLIEAGADTDLYDDDGWSPIMGAASKGNLALVKLFIKHGADIKQTVSSGLLEGESPLSLAKDNGHKDVVDYLLRIGAN